MVKQALIFASILSGALLVGIFAYSTVQQKKEFNKLKIALAEISEAAETQGEAAEENAARAERLNAELTNSQARIEALIKEKEAVTEKQAQMENQMRTALQNKDVTISELRGSLTVNILDRVLFDSGQAELKPEGQQVLEQLASVLMQHTNRQVYVIGHTDNVPIRATAYSRYPSNWELSTGRAVAAVRFLTENAGVDPARLAAVGYGEHHPVADNSTAEGRARNRRIAIVIVPEHFNPLESPKPGESEQTTGPVEGSTGTSGLKAGDEDASAQPEVPNAQTEARPVPAKTNELDQDIPLIDFSKVRKIERAQKPERTPPAEPEQPRSNEVTNKQSGDSVQAPDPSPSPAASRPVEKFATNSPAVLPPTSSSSSEPALNPATELEPATLSE